MATWFSRPIMKGSPEPRQSTFHTGPERMRLAAAYTVSTWTVTFGFLRQCELTAARTLGGQARS